MKKMKILALMALTTLVLSGCQTTSDREAALEDQVEQLEQQVTSLEQQQSEPDSHYESQDEVSVPDDVSDETAQEDTSENSVSFSNEDLDSLAASVNDIIKKVDKLVSGGASNQQEFFTLQDEFNEVENRMDYYEEQIEYDFRQGNLSHDEARKAEFDLEKLEDKLDNAEEKLEYAFGYDD